MFLPAGSGETITGGPDGGRNRFLAGIGKHQVNSAGSGRNPPDRFQPVAFLPVQAGLKLVECQTALGMGQGDPYCGPQKERDSC